METSGSGGAGVWGTGIREWGWTHHSSPALLGGGPQFILRGWCLVFSILSGLMVLSVVDGRMAYLQGSYTGYLGFWTDCRRHKCPNLGQVTVLIHMSKGFMLLAMALCLVLLLSMGLSFQPIFRRPNKVDFLFSFLSISIGLLIFLSLMLFAVNCQILQPRPQVSYLVTFYLCWCASALLLCARILSYLNQVGVWSQQMSSSEGQVSSHRWTLHQGVLKHPSLLQNSEQSLDLPSSSTVQEHRPSISKNLEIRPASEPHSLTAGCLPTSVDKRQALLPI